VEIGGWIGKLPDGRYKARLDLRAIGGGRPSKTCRLEREAKAWLNDQLTEALAGNFAGNSKMTLAELLGVYLKICEAGGLSPTTMLSYRRNSKRIIEGVAGEKGKRAVDGLGELRLRELAPERIDRFSAQLGKAGLGARTRHHHLALLHAAFAYAIRKGWARQNPVDRAEWPRVSKRGKGVSADDPEHLLAIMRACEGTQLYVPVLLAATAGLRASEVCGLRWADVDLEAATLHVCNARICAGAGDYRDKDPKSEASDRIAELPPFTVRMLRDFHAKQTRWALLQGKAWAKTGYVCTKLDGQPMGRISSGNYARRLASKKVAHLRFHDLRRSYINLMLAGGISPVAVAEIVGHADTSTTLGTYGFTTPAQRRSRKGVVDAAFPDAAPAASVKGARGPYRKQT